MQAEPHRDHNRSCNNFQVQKSIIWEANSEKNQRQTQVGSNQTEIHVGINCVICYPTILELPVDIVMYELLTEERTLLCSTVTLLIALLIQVASLSRLTSISEVTWRIPRSHDHRVVERFRSRRAVEPNELVNSRYASSYPTKCPWRNFMGSYSRFSDDGILRMH